METRIEALTGVMEYKPLSYRIVGGKVARRWWQWWLPREQWFLMSEFASLGPFENYADVAVAASIARRV